MRRAALLLLLLAAAGCGGGSSGTKAPAGEMARSPFAGAEVQAPSPAPDFALRDQDGKLVRLSSLRGRYVLVTFLYTRCPDVCPLIADHLNASLRRLGARRSEVRVLAVSVDPKGDTTAAIRRYVRAHNLLPEFRYLHGTRAELAPIWNAYDVTVHPANLETVDHTTYTLLVDPKGKGRLVYDSQVKTKDVVTDLQRLRQRA